MSAPHLAMARQHLAQSGLANVDFVHLQQRDDLGQLAGIDLFFSLIVLQHNPPPVILDILDRAFAALNPGGVAFFQVPTYREGYRFSATGYWQDVASRTAMEIHFVPQAAIFDLAGRHGLRLLEVRNDNCLGSSDSTISNTFLMRKAPFGRNDLEGRRREDNLRYAGPLRYGPARMKPAPYPTLDLDPGAPLDRHRATVLPEWIDWNGHMNVGYYVVAFDKATDTLCQQFAVGWEYTRDRIGMTFVLEAHVTYDREVKQGDPLRITTQILDHDAKRVHYIHAMYHATEGYLAATNELMLMNIDYETRRSAPWPDYAMERLDRIAAAHKLLPVPAQAGRLIGIKKK